MESYRLAAGDRICRYQNKTPTKYQLRNNVFNPRELS